MRRALGYARVSKDEREKLSIDYQITEITKYCDREGWTLVGVEVDEGITAKTILGLPAAQRVMAAVEANQVEAVVVWKSDRLNRDGIETLLLEGIFISHRVQYLSVTEGLLSGDGVEDEFMRFIRAGLNQRERKLQGLRTKAAFKRKRERGEYVCGRPPYGWKAHNRALIKEPTEQRVIQLVRRLKRRGGSVPQICRELRARDIRTRKGTYFCDTQVHRLLRTQPR